MLLGQGDFIRHLMDLLAYVLHSLPHTLHFMLCVCVCVYCSDDLCKPASTLYLHNLTGVLEAAVRATNAQYDNAEALQRLDVRMLDFSPGDKGWDVFSLHYHVEGPIGTVSSVDDPYLLSLSTALVGLQWGCYAQVSQSLQLSVEKQAHGILPSGHVA